MVPDRGKRGAGSTWLNDLNAIRTLRLTSPQAYPQRLILACSARSGRTFLRFRLGGMHRAWGSVIISDGERAVWTGGGRAVHYREKAAHFKELASVELHPRARAQLLGLAAEYDQLAEMRLPETGPGSLLLVGVKVG